MMPVVNSDFQGETRETYYPRLREGTEEVELLEERRGTRGREKGKPCSRMLRDFVGDSVRGRKNMTEGRFGGI